MYNPYDFYFKKAKLQGYKARSAFKLEEIQQKFHIFDAKTRAVLDIGCAPGSWLQYAVATLGKLNAHHPVLLGVDIKPSTVNLPGVVTAVQDITDQEGFTSLIQQTFSTQLSQDPHCLDVILSDMAPNTIGAKDIDAIRLFSLLEQVMRVFKNHLKPTGKFVIKVFMGPGFEEFIRTMKELFGGTAIKSFKPSACRKESKEIYIIKM